MENYEVYRKAFRKACKYLRQHPPCDAGWDGDMEIIKLIVDAESDPEGVRWMAHFIHEVLQEEEGHI